jgi:uncharacterized membrane protein YkvA (DUF1232 family)
VPWWSWSLVAVGGLLAVWAALLVASRRLPPGAARDLARLLPDTASMLRRLRRDPRVPRSAKVAVVVALVWVLSPIDLIPEFLPVIGPLDDVLVGILVIRFVARRVPREVIVDAWPETSTLPRWLGG